MFTPPPLAFIGTTTVETAEQADQLAKAIVENKLAGCVQVEGPIQSHYRWEGQVTSATEYRVVVKFLPEQAVDLERWLSTHHPYQIPQWLAVPVHFVGGKYLSWLREHPTH